MRLLAAAALLSFVTAVPASAEEVCKDVRGLLIKCVHKEPRKCVNAHGKWVRC